MKFWELTSVAGRADVRAAIIEIAASDSKWASYRDWAQSIDRLCAEQDRSKLDHELPSEFCRKVLGGLDVRFYLSGTWLRSRRHNQDDKELTALEAFDRFGGAALEDALEKGSWLVEGSK